MKHGPITAPERQLASLPLVVLHREDVVQRPVKVIGDVGYLLEQALRGVARYTPRPTVSTSNSP
jgi:hypothetical protein